MRRYDNIIPDFLDDDVIAVIESTCRSGGYSKSMIKHVIKVVNQMAGNYVYYEENGSFPVQNQFKIMKYDVVKLNINQVNRHKPYHFFISFDEEAFEQEEPILLEKNKVAERTTKSNVISTIWGARAFYPSKSRLRYVKLEVANTIPMKIGFVNSSGMDIAYMRPVIIHPNTPIKIKPFFVGEEKNAIAHFEFMGAYIMWK